MATEWQREFGFGACTVVIAFLAVAAAAPAVALTTPNPSGAAASLVGAKANSGTIVAQAPNPPLPRAAVPAPAPAPEAPADQPASPTDSGPAPDPFGGTGGGGSTPGGATPGGGAGPPPPDCTPVVPSTVEIIDDNGNHTAPSNGSFVAQVTAPGHNIHATISGVQACGGNHVALTITDHAGNFACDVAMSGNISVVIGAYNSPSDTVTITAVHGSGC